MGKVINPTLKRYTFAKFFAILQKEWPVCSVFCFVSSCIEANTMFSFINWYKEANLLPTIDYWSHFAEVTECLLMFLLNALLDLTPELDVFCRSFATQNTSVSLHSYLTYQINFPPPYPGNYIFNPPCHPSFISTHPSSIRKSTVD